MINNPLQSLSTQRSTNGLENVDIQDPLIPYRFGKLLGQGAVSLVYQAWDKANREVAIKLLQPDYRLIDHVDRLFLEEAQTLGEFARFDLFPKTYAWGKTDGLGPYLVMQRIHGKTLKQRVAEKHDDFLTLVSFVEASARGLARLHHQGVFHLDIKPSKIMVEERHGVNEKDKIHLTGFKFANVKSAIFVAVHNLGLSVLPGDRIDADDLTYMPPERAQDEKLDERIDVFGIGGVLCWLLTGQPPCVDKNEYQIGISRYFDDLSQRLSQIYNYPCLVDLTKRSLAFEPNDRPQTALAVADELSTWILSQTT